MFFCQFHHNHFFYWSARLPFDMSSRLGHVKTTLIKFSFKAKLSQAKIWIENFFCQFHIFLFSISTLDCFFTGQPSYFLTNQVDSVMLEKLAHGLIFNLDYTRTWVWRVYLCQFHHFPPFSSLISFYWLTGMSLNRPS